MEESLTLVAESSREERVRSLGFNPDHLTVEEQEELLELEVLCPDEALSA